MITPLDSSVMDANSEALGIGVPVLMSNAGKAIASVLSERFPGKRIAFVCGNGNNGGDGIAAATHMGSDAVTVFLLKPEGSFRSEFIRGMLSGAKFRVKGFTEFEEDEFDVIVDCALGTGLSGEVRPPYDGFIRTANRFKGYVVSADVPSGLGTSLSVMPDITIALHDVKEGMDHGNSGEIIVKDIGIPKEAYENVGPGDMLRYPVPSKDGHKGSNGKLLVIGGGPYYGAPAMSALAAMRTGVDIVRLAVPEICSSVIASFSPVLMIVDLPGKSLTIDHLDRLLELSKEHDAVLIGPGIGTSAEASETVRRFAEECPVPMVIDADGLTALGNGFVSKGKTVLTPHLKEFKRIGGDPDGDDPVMDLAKKMNSVILLKGRTDRISDGERMRYNTTGSPGMTSAGTGDVLAGIVAGLLSKGMTCFDAAALGAFISGKAGEFSFDERSYGMTATDVIDNIPKVLREYLR
ncbi:MAG: NAD(P)H-hydrate dehydratase [Candidatus Methanoplasma sp.]|jgi:NAD(P)H-hydrate epimerase|nr:NAD(P)H-hydrate dehydratase [Candidatus Methanoplasma sp.]